MTYIFLLDKQVQYPSLDSIQNDLIKFRLNPVIANNLTDVKSKLDHVDNCSSEEEIDTQEMIHTPVERPLFDRSTKVLNIRNIIKN